MGNFTKSIFELLWLEFESFFIIYMELHFSMDKANNTSQQMTKIIQMIDIDKVAPAFEERSSNAMDIIYK